MKYVTCNLCGADDWEVKYPATIAPDEDDRPDVRAFRCTSSGYGRHAQIVSCQSCGYIYANPVWEPDDLIGMYEAVEDNTYVEEQDGRRLTFSKHLQTLESVTGPARGRRLLDVGAYIGVFVDVALAAGWDAMGVEPSAWAVSVAQQKGLPVVEGTQEADVLHGRQFDVVTMWDVIEHVADPSAELAKAYDLLKPGGYLAVHTMDIDSLTARLMGPRWPWLMTMHIHYFSRRTLCQMLEKNRFEIVWSGAEGRYIRLNYLSSRLGGFHPLLGRAAAGVINGLKIGERPVPINLGDLFTVYAKKVVSL